MARKKTAQGRKAKKKRPNGAEGSQAANAEAARGPAPAPGRASGWGGGGGRGGAASGPVPNLFWGHVSMEQLRATPRFVGLPEAEQLMPLPSAALARYLRQESAAWAALHPGLLSTGLLKEALGLREPRAARQLGGRNESSHAPLLAAWNHLRAPHPLPPPLGPRAEEETRQRALADMEQALQRQRQRQRQGQDGSAEAEAEAEGGPPDDGSPCGRYRRCAAALSGGGLVGVRCAWGKAAEGAALAALLQMFPGSRLHEADQLRAALAWLLSRVPIDPGEGADGDGDGKSGSDEPDAGQEGHEDEEWEEAEDRDPESEHQLSEAGTEEEDALLLAASSGVRRGGKGRLVSELVLSDPGPRRAVPPLWVPQVQMHMAAAGCASGLIVSRSATKGLMVFRMWRDDEYVQRMMELLERVSAEYVRPGRPPPPDMFAREPAYVAFLSTTCRLARGATPLTPSPWRPAGGPPDRDLAFVTRSQPGAGNQGNGA
ncbi:hypothetical protein GPECTOR_6g863 [Gonium pectorale]|uniref:Uncharacterized protein n=1 Tax=Gonium pectorale TaxID=33097 RepID=A0A150GVU6_GONPE|nr:hypothetical protein GPECTOR_6g863 [Gonium pectorale]|eukprot:KXZ53945.1 hypothetical protein GPECTOR_6g863 [Gonium pectorale]